MNVIARSSVVIVVVVVVIPSKMNRCRGKFRD